MKINRREFFAFLFLMVGTVANTLAIPGENAMVRLLMGCGGLLALGNIVFEKYSRQQIGYILCLLALSILIYLKAGEASPFVTVVALVIFRGIDFDRILDITLYTKAILIVVKVVPVILGFVENPSYQYWRGDHFITRYTFGVSGTANPISIQIAVVSFILIYKIRDLRPFKKILALALIFIVNYYFYTYTKSQTSMIMIVIVILISVLTEVKTLRRAFLKTAPWILPGLILFAIIPVTLLYNTTVFSTLDILMSGRLGYNRIMISAYGFSLFGANMSGSSIIYDNSYMRILTNLGILYAVFIFVGMFYLTEKKAKEQNLRLVIFIVAFQILAFMESIYGYVFANITLLLLDEILLAGEHR